MFEIARKVIHDCLTGMDGHSYDPARVFWALGNLVFFALSIFSVVKTGTIDLVAWATAFSAVQIAGAGGVMVKANTEPKA